MKKIFSLTVLLLIFGYTSSMAQMAIDDSIGGSIGDVEDPSIGKVKGIFRGIFPTGTPGKNYIKCDKDDSQICFTINDRSMVSYQKKGVVEIFDPKTGAVMITLEFSKFYVEKKSDGSSVTKFEE
jgi:hypothetical protein